MVIVAAKKKRPYHHGNLRAALIDAGLKLIGENGVRALTLREIATQVGVSRMAPYRHFADKGDLLAAIAEAGFTTFADALDHARQTPGGFPERLAAMAFAYIRFAMEHPAHIEVMFGSEGHLADREIEAGTRAFSILVETIAEGQASRDVRPGDPVMLAQVVWSQVHGMSMLRLATDLSSDGPGAKLVNCSSEILLAGLRP
jgi:AcrR family transcriptional regulator